MSKVRGIGINKDHRSVGGTGCRKWSDHFERRLRLAGIEIDRYRLCLYLTDSHLNSGCCR